MNLQIESLIGSIPDTQSRPAVSRFRRIALVFSFFAMLAGSAAAQSPRKTPDWWMRTDLDARILLNQVLEAEASQGNADAQVNLARMFARGYGSPEGPKLAAAQYWLQRAMDKGAVHANGMAAVLYAIAEPPNLSKAGELMEGVIAAEKARGKTIGRTLSPACLASPYCVGYTHIVTGYCHLFVVYPMSARRDGKEANFLAEVNLEKGEVKIKGQDVPPEFAEATRSVLEAALKNVPVPPEFDSKGYIVQIPLSFKLDGLWQ